VEVRFDPFRDLKSPDPTPRYRELRAHAPVHWSPEAGIFSLSRYEDVLGILRDAETFSSEAQRTILSSAMQVPITPRYGLKLLQFLIRSRVNPLKVIDAGNLISIDGARHAAMRNIVSRGFTPRRIAAWGPRVSQLVETHVASMRKRERIDVIADLAVPLPTTVIAEMLGVEPDRRDEFKRWSGSIIDVASGAAREDLLGSGVIDDLTDMFVYLKQVIRRRRAQPRDDLVSVLVDPAQGDVLDEIDVIQFIVLLLVAGNETTTNLVGNAVHALLHHPRQLDLVVEHPDRIPDLVEETLRFDPPLAMSFRSTTRDVELRGVSIPKGSNIALLTGAANRDERRFVDPDRFDVERGAEGHLGFGHGEHFCLGASLARLQARTALAALVPELPRFRHAGGPDPLIDSFFLRGRKHIELVRS
jgi:cytochrome P450